MTAPPTDKRDASSPLLRRYVDNGHEMVAVAAWFYDEMCKSVEAHGNSPPQEVLKMEGELK